MSDDLTSIELFAGGGGMALGTRRAGFKHLALVEWYKPAAQILKHNGRLNPSFWVEGDVYQRDVREWLAETSLGSGSGVDLVAGGPPCQPFSLGGVHAGDDDARNMFPASLDAVRKFRPKFVIFENVPGLTRPSFAPYFAYIKRQLEKPTVVPKTGELWTEHDARIQRSRPTGLRYHVYEQILDAADFGLPQNRRRVFLVAVRSDLSGSDTWTEFAGTYSRDALLYDQWVSGDYWDEHDLPMPELPEGLEARVLDLKDNGRPENDRWQTIRDIVADLPEPVNGEDAEEITNHRGIAGARAYPKHSGSPFDWPAKTIKAGVHGVSGGEAMIRFEDESLRYFTVRESARMQGFPDVYEFSESRSRNMGAIGNAVAVPVAEMIARRLRSRFIVEHSEGS